ncbi:hypothetical protein A9Q84_08725 [Halobacteriovorax marinus]|uniref:Co-chaperone DjlA N-terminal domain-containing protein n=1 Tax=Halobacteriovorax marinus TaxID=97084 RepID=A0A1Y5F6A4_9BACT|nr:hypothetical protein A9Q84_08725 [Halobacteriovorax marinus]
MSFWDIFNTKQESKRLTNLQQSIIEHFPTMDEEKRILLASLAALCARVAYVDFNVCEKEQEAIEKALEKWMELPEDQAKFIAEIAVLEVKELAGLDARKYCTTLNDFLDNTKKMHILETLFQVSAADDHVEAKESEEIRVIATGLLLEHKHFVAARATVAKFIGALNK